jgi:hypothetical protein
MAEAPCTASMRGITFCEGIGILEGEVNPINRIIRKPAAIRANNQAILLYPVQLWFRQPASSAARQ